MPCLPRRRAATKPGFKAAFDPLKQACKACHDRHQRPTEGAQRAAARAIHSSAAAAAASTSTAERAPDHGKRGCGSCARRLRPCHIADEGAAIAQAVHRGWRRGAARSAQQHPAIERVRRSCAPPSAAAPRRPTARPLVGVVGRHEPLSACTRPTRQQGQHRPAAQGIVSGAGRRCAFRWRRA